MSIIHKNTNAAILFLKNEYHTSKQRIMGRHSANESFLNAWFRYSGHKTLYSFVPTEHDHIAFQQRAQQCCSPHRISSKGISFHRPELLEEPGTLYIPDPNLSEHAFIRQTHQLQNTATARYSLCGITHTLSSEGAMALVNQLVTAPVYSWDALICTSNAVKQSVKKLIALYAEYLAEKFSITVSYPALQLPVIPLGVDCSQFKTGDERVSIRREWRQTLNITDDTIVILFFGRLSFHAKSNPFPLFTALQAIYTRSNKKLHLLMTGQFANDGLRSSFQQAAEVLCPDVTVTFLDGGDINIRRNIWYAADIFTSLSDNIQETFGITPIEAMAAGLPSVVSDWDGYRDTIEHQSTGFLVPSIAPAPGTVGTVLAQRFASRLDNYDHYIANASKYTAIDIPSTIGAFEVLIHNEPLRQSMGTAARRRAENTFDWKHIIPQYKNLWAELTTIRTKETSSRSDIEYYPPVQQRYQQNPNYPDPFFIFGHYASTTLQKNCIIGLRTENVESCLDSCLALNIVNFGLKENRGIMLEIVKLLTSRSLSAQSITSTLHNIPEDEVIRAILWLTKIGIVSINV